MISSVKKVRQSQYAVPIRFDDQSFVFRVADSRDLKKIGELRHDVWTSEGVYVPDFDGSPRGVWLDDQDTSATHFIVEVAGKMIASARVSTHHELSTLPDIEWLEPMAPKLTTPCVSLNRLVVNQEYRGLGIARHLDMMRMNYSFDIGAKSAVVIGVGENRVKAIEALGFEFSHYLPTGNGLMNPEYPLGALYLQL